MALLCINFLSLFASCFVRCAFKFRHLCVNSIFLFLFLYIVILVAGAFINKILFNVLSLSDLYKGIAKRVVIGTCCISRFFL